MLDFGRYAMAGVAHFDEQVGAAGGAGNAGAGQILRQQLLAPANAPSQWRAVASISPKAWPQPISLTGFRVTLPPSALLISWPPRQWPITGMFLETASRISAQTGSIHGKGSLTLIGPPMKQRPAYWSAVAGTSAPSSRAINFHGIPCCSRNMAK